MMVFVYLFIFLFVMIGLVIFLELYAKYCAENNNEVIQHIDWLGRVGMYDTRFIVNKRWKHKW